MSRWAFFCESPEPALPDPRCEFFMRCLTDVISGSLTEVLREKAVCADCHFGRAFGWGWTDDGAVRLEFAPIDGVPLESTAFIGVGSQPSGSSGSTRARLSPWCRGKRSHVSRHFVQPARALLFRGFRPAQPQAVHAFRRSPLFILGRRIRHEPIP
jgi:hypothetical protein